MKKVPRSPANRAAVRPVGNRPVRRPRPRFGPDPIPQPVPGILGRDAVLRPRRLGARSVARSGRGAAAPLRFIFIRRPKRPASRAPRPSARKPRSSTGPAGRKVSGTIPWVDGFQEKPTRTSPGVSSRPETAPSPWVPPPLPASLEPEDPPQGLPPVPPMLLEDDDGSTAPVLSASGPGPVGSSAGVGITPGTTVWLTGCDPMTLMLGWEEPSGPSAPLPAATEWRLRSVAEPDSVLAAGPLPGDRRFLFVEAPPQTVAHVAEIGSRGEGGDWKCLATSAPVSLPEPAPIAEVARPNSSPGSRGLRPGFSAEYFESLIGIPTSDPGTAGSSGFGVAIPRPLGVRRAASGAIVSSASSADLAAETGSVRPGFWGPSSADAGTVSADFPEADGFHLRVNAEVLLFGSTEPGARVTLRGRPVPLRPDGSFTFRCALPDGRFELPLVAISPRGTGYRSATLTLARSTIAHGDVGVHPADPQGLRPPDAIP